MSSSRFTVSAWLRQLPGWRQAALLAAALAMASTAAQAVPSFARQTGMDCAGCHVGAFGPQLTPAGIRFKIGGYTESDGKDGKLALSGMAVASWARTRAGQDPAPDHLKANNNVTLDEVSLFLAGRIAPEVGAFVQVTHNGIDHSTALDQADVRWARNIKLGGKDTVLGVTVNNNPGVQDPFNTSPVWSYPYIGPEAAFGTGPAATLINGGLAQRVVGSSAYGFWNDSIYAELGTYRSLSPGTQRKFGLDRDEQRLGRNAYWRLAYFKDFGAQNLSAGAFGWTAQLAPDRSPGTLQERYRDVGFDANYQFLGTREHIATLGASVVREHTRPGDGGDAGSLTERRLNASYSHNNTWGVSGGLFDTSGKDPAASTRGQLLQVDWTPWGKEDHAAPSPFGWANVRLGLQAWRYTRFEGDAGSARDHDTLHFFVWTAF
jgi:hypothetical protein